MTKNIVQMARDAGIAFEVIEFYRTELEVFAKMISEVEHKACLEIADQCADADLHASVAANSIRQRGKV